jgi:hypothetical protein
MVVVTCWIGIQKGTNGTHWCYLWATRLRLEGISWNKDMWSLMSSLENGKEFFQQHLNSSGIMHGIAKRSVKKQDWYGSHSIEQSPSMNGEAKLILTPLKNVKFVLLEPLNRFYIGFGSAPLWGKCGLGRYIFSRQSWTVKREGRGPHDSGNANRAGRGGGLTRM